MAKIDQVVNGESGASARAKINEAMKTVSHDSSLSGTGEVATPLQVVLSGRENLDNGQLTGGEVTINVGDPTLFDVAAGTGMVINWVNSSTPVRTPVSWSAFIGETLPDISEPFTNVSINAAAGIVKTSGVQNTPQDRRTIISLQSLIHLSGVQIDSVSDNVTPAYQKIEAVLDWILEAGPINGGNRYSANGVNLSVDKTSGTTTLPFINQNIDPQSPTTEINGALTAASLVRVFRDGVGGFTQVPFQSFVDPDNFDDGSGILQTVGNNKFTVQRFYFFGQIATSVLTYGQAIYNSIQEAENAIFTEGPEVSPLTDAATFTTALIVKKSTTDLTNLSENRFVDIALATSSGTASLQDMQGVYQQSFIPQIITDAIRLALTIRIGSGADTDKGFEVQNTAGAEVFSVTGLGDVNSTDIKVNGEAFADEEIDNGNSGAADTIDFTMGNFQKSTLDGSPTYTFTNPSGPTTVILRLIQDATGSRVATWPATVKWPGGTAPTLTTTALAVDIVAFYFDGTSFNGTFILDSK